MGSGKITGIYVELRSDPRQLKADLDAQKTIVKNAAANMSDAMGGAIPADKLKKNLNSLVSDLSQLERSSKIGAASFREIGFTATDLGARLNLPEKQLAMLQQRMFQTQAADMQVASLRRIAQQAGLTTAEIRKLGREMGVSDENIAKAGGGGMLSSFGLGAAGNAGVAIATVYAVGRTVKETGQAIYDNGSKFERLEKSLSAIGGSKSAAAGTLSFLRQESDKAGASLLETSAAYKDMLASGTASGMQETDIRSLFSSVVEAGAVVGMTQEQQSRSLLALSQMMSKGTVQSEELRQQLGESLPGAYAVAAKAMGVTTQQLSKMLEQGQVVAKDFLPKFAVALRKEFAGSLDDAANTGTAAINRLDNSWTQLKANLYDSQPIINAANNIRAITDAMGGAGAGGASPKDSTEALAALREQKGKLEEERAKWQNAVDNQFTTGIRSGGQVKLEELDVKLKAINKEIEDIYVASGKNVVDVSRLRTTDESTKDQRENAYKFQVEQQEKSIEAALKLKAVMADIAIAREQATGGGEFNIKRMQEEKQHAQTMLGYQKELTRAKLDATVDTGTIQKSMALENERHAVLMGHLRAEEARTLSARKASMQVSLDKLSDITGFYDSIKEMRANADVEAFSQDPVTKANAYIKRDASIAQAERARIQSMAKESLSLQAELAANQGTIAGLTATYDPKKALDSQANTAILQGKQRELELTKQIADAERDLGRARALAATDSDPLLTAEIENLTTQIELLKQVKQSNDETTKAKADDIKASRDAASGTKSALKSYSDMATNEALNNKQAWTNSFGAAEDSLTEFSTKGKINIESLGETIRAEIFRTQMIRPVLGTLAKGIDTGGLFSGLKGFFASIFHDGGTVGSTAAPARQVSPLLFMNAPRFHNGLKDDEYPAILQRGEDVVSRAEKAKLRSMAGSMGQNSSPTYHVELTQIMDFRGADSSTETRLRASAGQIKREAVFESTRAVRALALQGGGYAKDLNRRV